MPICEWLARACRTTQAGLSGMTILMLAATLTVTLQSTSVHAAAEARWPEPTLPESLTTFAMGQAMTVDGLPMRLQGFVSPQPPSALVQEIRRSLGQPLVESSSGSKRILGRPEGRFYLTVQIEASGSGSKGVVATADRRSHRVRTIIATAAVVASIAAASPPAAVILTIMQRASIEQQ